MGWMVQGSNSNGVSFSIPIQKGPSAHAAFCTMDTRSLSPGVKWLGCDLDHPPPPISTKVKERAGLYFYSPSGLSWPVLG